MCIRCMPGASEGQMVTGICELPGVKPRVPGIKPRSSVNTNVLNCWAIYPALSFEVLEAFIVFTLSTYFRKAFFFWSRNFWLLFLKILSVDIGLILKIGNAIYWFFVEFFKPSSLDYLSL